MPAWDAGNCALGSRHSVLADGHSAAHLDGKSQTAHPGKHSSSAYAMVGHDVLPPMTYLYISSSKLCSTRPSVPCMMASMDLPQNLVCKHTGRPHT